LEEGFGILRVEPLGGELEDLLFYKDLRGSILRGRWLGRNLNLDKDF
jgi:hypothetical protein